MKQIESQHNAQYQAAKRLLQKKYRKEERLYLVDGFKLVRDALRFGRSVKTVFCCEKTKAAAEALPLGKDCDCCCLPEELLNRLSEAQTPQGIVAVVQGGPEPFTPPQGKALLLDRIQDPSNLGAILRTAVATDYRDVYLLNCADAFAPKTLRSAMSAQFVLRLQEIEGSQLSQLSQCGEFVCADMNGENVFSAGVDRRHVLVLGNEGQGVEEAVRKLCHKTVSIPMLNGLESLNVAVSAGVIMYALLK